MQWLIWYQIFYIFWCLGNTYSFIQHHDETIKVGLVHTLTESNYNLTPFSLPPIFWYCFHFMIIRARAWKCKEPIVFAKIICFLPGKVIFQGVRILETTRKFANVLQWLGSGVARGLNSAPKQTICFGHSFFDLHEICWDYWSCFRDHISAFCEILLSRELAILHFLWPLLGVSTRHCCSNWGAQGGEGPFNTACSFNYPFVVIVSMFLLLRPFLYLTFSLVSFLTALILNLSI